MGTPISDPTRSDVAPAGSRLGGVALGLVIGGAAVWAVREWQERDRAGRLAIEQRLAQLEEIVRNYESRDGAAAPAARRPKGDDAAPRGASSGGGASLAGKPLEEVDAAARVREGTEESSMARALERASRMAEALHSREGAAPAGEPPEAPLVGALAPSAAPTVSPSSASDAPKEPAAPALDAETIVKAFNELLADAGLDRWRLLSALPLPEERSLGDAVLADRGLRGTATGSLVAERLGLQRDPITGIAALVATGAHGIEEGVEVHYEGARYRIEIPGVLPVELVPAPLRQLFGMALDPRPPADVDVLSAVALVNRALGLEKALTLRFRSVDLLDGDKFAKAVIDLEFDDNGLPIQTVLADAAWFEIDPKNRYGELRCEGGEMVAGGQKRPLYKGKFRLPLRDLTPEHWKGVPGVQRVAGS
jgi:hypothetical protein